MDDNSQLTLDEASYWGQHRFLLFISISIVIALALVGIGMGLYATSGAAQLDLSRPGYIGVSNQAAVSVNTTKGYSASGSINNESLLEFQKMYSEQATKAKAVDAFSGDPLSPDTLEINNPIE
jgi:hypothetical protein